jgi:tetratricopeptide (TPR) repeat protein
MPLFEQALTIYERVLGNNHPDIASCLNNLAELYQAQGAYERALPLYERALALRERVLGNDHPSTATSLNSLAVLYANQGQFALALPLLERAIMIWQVRLGAQHPNTVQAQQNFAAIHQVAAVADLPEAVHVAMATQDQGALQQALAALPPDPLQAAVGRLMQATGISDPLAQFTSLIQAIAVVADGDQEPRFQIEAVLARLERCGFHLTAAIQAIWAGQYDPTVLSRGLDDTDTALVLRVLSLLERKGRTEIRQSSAIRPQCPAASASRPPSVQDAGAFRRAAALASAHAKVAAVGADPQAREDLAARFRSLADRHEQGDPPDPDLAAQLRALAARLTS